VIKIPGGDGTGPWGTGGCGVPGGYNYGLKGGFYGRGGRRGGYWGYGRFPGYGPYRSVPPYQRPGWQITPISEKQMIDDLEIQKTNLENALNELKNQIESMKNSQKE